MSKYRSKRMRDWLLPSGSAALLGFSLVLGNQAASGQEVPALTSAEVNPRGLSVPSSGDTPTLPPRDLAPGVLITVAPDQNAGDTAIGPLDLDFVSKHPELAWSAPDFEGGSPNFASPSETLLEMGRGVTLRHPVWALEFSFKPMRTIEVDLPQKSGRLKRKLVWYLVYRLRYVGGDLLPDVYDVQAGTGVANRPKEVVFKSVRFLPRFTLINTQTKVEMDSTIVSSAIPAISQRERVGKPLLDTFQVARQEILPSLGDEEKAVWGVAIWTDVDPRTDFFIVQVKGLTNAYQMDIDNQGNKSYRRKTLQIHFWRPGDTIGQTEDRIRLGVPAFIDNSSQEHILKQFGKQFGIEKRLDYQWIYR